MSDLMMTSSSALPPSPERVGPIRIERRLKRGGMGDVFCGVHEILRREVVVKMAIAENPQQGFLRRSLLREARALASVKHRNVVTIFDVGYTNDGAPYAVLELLDGRSLDGIIDAHGGLPPQAVLRISAEVLAGMGAFHRRDFVMVDIKPDNVMVVGGPLVNKPASRSCWIKLIDLGAVRLARRSQAALTVRLDHAVGSCWYMSPEAVLGMNLDARTDLYAFGVLVYEMCTGKVPFLAVDADEILQMHLYAQPPLLSTVCAWVEPGGGLERLVHACLQKSPEDRPSSVEQAFRLLSSATERRLTSTSRPPDMEPQALEHTPTLLYRPRHAAM